MKIIDLIKSEKISISCELFPPKKGGELNNALEIVHKIAENGVDYMSVTYGAGGTSSGETAAIAGEIEKCGIPALAHLTCINSTEDKIEKVLVDLKSRGVQNIMALRGDKVPGAVEDPAYKHANELVAKIKTCGDFCIGGACYPEGHPEASGLNEDIEHTRLKIEAGCDFLVSQMVFDNTILYNYMYRLMSKGIFVPVVPGIMPVINARQIARICDLSAISLPPHFRAIVEKFADKPEALKQAGIAYAMGQVVDLIANGFRNVHIYTMNKPELIGAIRSNLSELLK